MNSPPAENPRRIAGSMPGRRFACRVLGGLLGSACLPAFAHAPVFDCFNDGDQVTCEGGFSDGGSAAGVLVRILDRNDKVLLEGKIDAAGRFSFARPKQEFHVLFDAGAGHTVTIFSTDITE